MVDPRSKKLETSKISDVPLSQILRLEGCGKLSTVMWALVLQNVCSFSAKVFTRHWSELLGSTVGSFVDQSSAWSRQERELERCEHREQWRMDETGVCAAKNTQTFLVFHCYKKNLQTRP
jgi:hypothetical protein